MHRDKELGDSLHRTLTSQLSTLTSVRGHSLTSMFSFVEVTCPLFEVSSYIFPPRNQGDAIYLSPRGDPGKASIPLTGDPRADADILAFYKARQKLIREFK